MPLSNNLGFPVIPQSSIGNPIWLWLIQTILTLRTPQSIYDVIVVGAGASGMMAAGRAAELGARVLVVERCPGRFEAGHNRKGEMQPDQPGGYPDLYGKLFPGRPVPEKLFCPFF